MALFEYIKIRPEVRYISAMNVLVDCTQITRNKAGVGVYAINLVKELLKHQSDYLRVWLLVQDDDPDFLALAEQIGIIKLPARVFRLLPFRFIAEQIYIPWIAYKLRIDVVHSLHYSFPLKKLKAHRVVTVHDLTSLVMPEVHTQIKLIYFKLFLWAASKYVDAIIFVSASTEKDWDRYFPKSPGKKFIIPLGKSRAYKPNLPNNLIDIIVKKYRLPNQYILYIGTIEPRKNLTRLVQAFAIVINLNPSLVLVIAGMKGWMYEELFRTIAALGISSKVIFTGFVDEDDKPYLIAGAAVFAYPSLYEGFGIPVLEALACAIPTLTSNRSSLPEVAGDAALLVDPENIDDIAINLSRLLEDVELRKHLQDRALRQAELFDWAYTAERTIEAYGRINSKPSG